MLPAVIISLIFLLSGCAGDYTQYAQTAGDISNDNRQMATQFIQQQMVLDSKVAESLKDNGTALVLYAIVSKDKMSEVIARLEVEMPKAPTTANDVWLGLGNTFLESTTTIGKWYIGASVIENIFDGYGTSYDFTSGGDLNVSDSLNTTTSSFGNLGDSNSLDLSNNSGQNNTGELPPSEEVVE